MKDIYLENLDLNDCQDDIKNLINDLIEENKSLKDQCEKLKSYKNKYIELKYGK
jgi:hypothetical protein